MADKLIRMAAQIADFWRFQPGQTPEEAVADHINKFWTYQMRRDLLTQLDTDSTADPLLRGAAAHIVVPKAEAKAG